MPYKLLVLTVTCALVAAEPPVTRKYVSVVGSGVTTDQGISSAKLTTAPTGGGMFVITDPGYYYLSDDLAPDNLTTANVPIIYINANNVVLDLATKSITAPTTNTTNASAAIQVADGKSNVTIKNGVINGIQGVAATGFGVLVNNAASTTVSHIVLENLAMYNCGYFGISIAKCNDLTIDNVQCTGNGPYTDAIKAGNPGAFSGGAYLNTINSATITNSVFSNNQWNIGSPTTANSIVGLYLNTCKSIDMRNCLTSGNANITTPASTFAAGVYLVSCSSCTFDTVTTSVNTYITTLANAGTSYGMFLSSSSNNNFRKIASFANTASTSNVAPTGGAGYGINASASSANYFEDCVFSSNSGISNGIGIAFVGSSNANQCRRCVAALNTSSQLTTVVQTVGVYGFFCSSCIANAFIDCRASDNNVPGSSAGASRIVAGFYSAACYSTQILNCQATGNNVSSLTTSTAQSTTVAPASFAAGIELGESTSSVERQAVIRDCIITGNRTITATTTTAPAFGILVLPTASSPFTGPFSSNNSIEHCYVANNLSDYTNAAQGLSYGIVDMTPGITATGGTTLGSSTLMRGNISVGHGSTFTGTTVNAFATSNMNYYLDYKTSAMQMLNNIKETNIANLNAIADINGLNLFNSSLINS